METGPDMEEIAGQFQHQKPKSDEKPGEYISEVERQIQDALTGPTGRAIDAPMKSYQDQGTRVALDQLGQDMAKTNQNQPSPSSESTQPSELSD